MNPFPDLSLHAEWNALNLNQQKYLLELFPELVEASGKNGGPFVAYGFSRIHLDPPIIRRLTMCHDAMLYKDLKGPNSWMPGSCFQIWYNKIKFSHC